MKRSTVKTNIVECHHQFPFNYVTKNINKKPGGLIKHPHDM
jgi:hypothetical protein